MDDVCIILQGYNNPKQIIKDIRYYNNLGFKNIIISSYNHLINDDIKLLAKTTSIKIKTKKKLDKKNIPYIHDKKNNMCIITKYFDDFDKISNHNYTINNINSINLHLLTTKNGIKLANELYPNCKYYLKLRLDMVIRKLDEKIKEWINIIKPISYNIPFKNKYILFGNIEQSINKEKKTNKIISAYNHYFYFNDYLMFGKKEDVNIYYNIPYITTEKQLKQTFKPLAESYFASYHYREFCKIKYQKKLVSNQIQLDKNKYNIILNNIIYFDDKIRLYWHKKNGYVHVNKISIKYIKYKK